MKRYVLMLALLGGVLASCSKNEEEAKKPLTPEVPQAPQGGLVEAGKAYTVLPEVGEPISLIRCMWI